jgi:hypothetical protein
LVRFAAGEAVVDAVDQVARFDGQEVTVDIAD